MTSRKSTLAPGDLVRLKSGGPVMTVAWIEDEEEHVPVHVVWFEGHTLHDETFLLATLEPKVT